MTEPCIHGPATKICHAVTRFPQCVILTLYLLAKAFWLCISQVNSPSVLGNALTWCFSPVTSPRVQGGPEDEVGTDATCPLLGGRLWPAQLLSWVCTSLSERAVLSPVFLGENTSLICAKYFFICIIHWVRISSQTQRSSQ